MVIPGPGYIKPSEQKEYFTNHETEDPHLSSIKKVTGSNIKATNLEIGEVEDFVIDDSNWKILFMIVDTGKWFPGKKVLISPEWAKKIEWDTSEVVVNATVDSVKQSPEYETGKEISESYEANLQNYYGNFISRK